MIALLKIQPSITQRLLAAELGVSAYGIKYHIDKMKSEGLIRHVGASIGGHWEVLQ
ncbi:MAG: winged helix-turn-helix transcriptional regulator [Chlorobium sp.]